MTSALQGLSFKPTTGALGTHQTTTFTLSDKSSDYDTATTDSTTQVLHINPNIISGPSGGNSIVRGTSGDDAIAAYKRGDTICANGGDGVLRDALRIGLLRHEVAQDLGPSRAGQDGVDGHARARALAPETSR